MSKKKKSAPKDFSSLADTYTLNLSHPMATEFIGHLSIYRTEE